MSAADTADIQALYAAWLPRINAHGISESEMEVVLEEIAAIERKLAAAHAVTAHELLIKVRIADHHRRTDCSVKNEQRDMLTSLIRDLHRRRCGAGFLCVATAARATCRSLAGGHASQPEQDLIFGWPALAYCDLRKITRGSC